MPLIELINHGDGANYGGTDSINFTGTFPGEIFAHYSDGDAFGFFLAWGFAIPRPLAFSIPLSGNVQSVPVNIAQRFEGPVNSERDWIPKIEKNAGNVAMRFLMIGNQRFPRLPKGIFYRLMRNAGYTGFEEQFDLIQHANRLHFLNLLKAVDGIDAPMARTLQVVAHHQLRAMSFCFGVREI
jgi:hypothetical protein